MLTKDELPACPVATTLMLIGIRLCIYDTCKLNVPSYAEQLLYFYHASHKIMCSSTSK